MDKFTQYSTLGVSKHEADLRHYLCFGHEHGPKDGGNHSFATRVMNTDDVIRDITLYVKHHQLTCEQIEGLSWWTSFKGSRYYNGLHNVVADLIRTLA